MEKIESQLYNISNKKLKQFRRIFTKLLCNRNNNFFYDFFKN